MKKINKNQDGSVLLGVICMTMFCMSMATIALGAVNYTTKETSRNVEKTQAKITAEATLNEFVQHYASTGGDYQDLKDAIGTYTVDYGAAGENFGNTKITVSNTTGGFIKVTANTEYLSQKGETDANTQAASAYFKQVLELPYVPDSTLAAAKGTNIGDVGNACCPIDGDTYIDKDSTAPTGLANGMEAKDYGHFFSANNINLNNTGTSFCDHKNTTGTQNYEPNKSNPNGAYFDQAPTLTVDGYLYANNDGTEIKTTVGKSDIEGRNADDTGYDASQLSNSDGYIYTFKKIVFSNSFMNIGETGKPIDVYCRGAYYGRVPNSINGTNTEANSIRSAYPGMQETDSKHGKMVGNLYCYKKNNGTGVGAVEQNGNLVINYCNGGSLTVEGDVFVDGDIILAPNSSLKVTGDLHCTGNIIVCSQGGTTMSVGDGTTLAPDVANTNRPSCLEIGGTIDTNLHNDVKRNIIPSEGYDPVTGTDSSTRKKLNDVFGESTPNDMFAASLGTPSTPEQADEKTAAKEIAAKYITAMDTTRSDACTEQPLGVSGVKTYQINKSVRLTPQQVGPDPAVGGDGTGFGYTVVVKNEDIVIALPLGTQISANFRIDRSQAGTGCFAYFMYYDPDANPVDSDGKLTDTVKDAEGNVISTNIKTPYLSADAKAFGVPVNTSITIDSKNYTFERSDPAGKKAFWYSSNKHLMMCDANFTGKPTLKESYEVGEVENNALGDNTVPPKSILTQKVWSIMLLPDGSEFELKGNRGAMHVVMYGPKANIEISGSQSYIIGKVNCSFFKAPQDAKYSVIKDGVAAPGSVLGFTHVKNNVDTKPKVRLMYYDFNKN